jgi:hypothetical protein
MRRQRKIIKGKTVERRRREKTIILEEQFVTVWTELESLRTGPMSTF